MTNPYIILISGELRVFDMPEAKRSYCAGKPFCCEGERCVRLVHSEEVTEAIKNAIKVENPEEAGYTIIEMKGRKFFYGPPTFGKQVPLENDTPCPLPKGLKVEIGWQIKASTIEKANDWINCSYENTVRKPGFQSRQIARLIKEPVNTEGATTRDEVTMGDAWMSGPEDFSKAIEEQINKYREMFPDSPIHVLGTVIPPLNQKEDLYPISKSVLYRSFDKSIGVPSQEFNAFLPAGPKPKPSKEKLERLSEKINSVQPFSESKLHETFDGPEITEGAEPSIKLTFYSGKLWNSDKPFPVKPEEQNYNPELRDHQYPDDLVIYWDKVKLWLSTAYEVVNPEVIPGVLSGKEVMKWNGTFKDGDQITLPEGYGIEKHYQPDSGPLVRRVSITLPEKDKYEVWFNDEWNVVSESQYLSMINNNKYGRINGVLENGDPEKPQIIGVKIKPDVEPSESQEETDDDLKEGIEDTLYSTGKFTPEFASEVTQEILRLVKKFHITRRK